MNKTKMFGERKTQNIGKRKFLGKVKYKKFRNKKNCRENETKKIQNI